MIPERIVQLRAGIIGGIQRIWGAPLRIDFDVTRTRGKHPNKANVKLYGLAQDSLRWLEQPGMTIQLLAGETIPSMLFQGDIDTRGVVHELSVPNFITNIASGDGRLAFKSARFTHSYTAGTSSVVILADIIASFAGSGMVVGYLDPSVVHTVYPGPQAFSGRSRDALDRLGTDLGFAWSIQDGLLEIVSLGNPTPGNAMVVSSATGMRGIPKRVKGGIEVTTLLAPRMKPGRLFVVNSVRAAIAGAFEATKVTHRGTSRGTTWETTIEGRPYTYGA